MAIPSIPQNFILQQGNQKAYLSWDLSVGATSYIVQRSTDAITYSTVDSPTENSFIDDTVVLGTKYFYKVAAVGASGTSGYCAAQSTVPAPVAELSLQELRLRAQQRADRVNSQFVKTEEWNFFLNQSMYELYDLLITTYEDYFEAPEIHFTVSGNQSSFDLPTGSNTFYDSDNNLVTPPAFYKLSGVDLGLNTVSNAYVTVDRYNMVDRNNYVFPNTASSIYGVFNLRYKLLGTKIRFIPNPSAGQVIRLLYVPRLPQLIADNDLTTIGFSGWLQYVIVRAAKYALDKEESDTSKLDAELVFLKGRIEETAQNRDQGSPATISDSRANEQSNGWNGPRGGY